MMAVHEKNPTHTSLIPSATAKYVPELDGIRAIAVTFVVAAHYRLLPYVPGGFGVTIFFFLSGYLITTLFFAELGKTNRIDIPKFYLRRWLRLTPNLVILVLLGSILHEFSRTAVGGDSVPLGTTMAALFYYTNYYDLAVNLDDLYVIPFGICWSLAVEEHFYLVWPLLLRNTLATTKRLLVIVIALCLAALAWRLIARIGLHYSSEYTYMATDCRIDSILYGALLRILFEAAWGPAIVRILRTRVSRALGALLIALTFVVRNDDFREIIRYSIQGLALMPFFTGVLCDSPSSVTRRLLASPPMVLVGRLSYSIYLFHLLGRTPGEVYFGSPDAMGSVVSGLLLTGATAYALNFFVERPIASLRHRFRGRAAFSPTEPSPRRSSTA